VTTPELKVIFFRVNLHKYILLAKKKKFSLYQKHRTGTLRT